MKKGIKLSKIESFASYRVVFNMYKFLFRFYISIPKIISKKLYSSLFVIITFNVIKENSLFLSFPSVNKPNLIQGKQYPLWKFYK